MLGIIRLFRLRSIFNQLTGFSDAKIEIVLGLQHADNFIIGKGDRLNMRVKLPTNKEDK